jgi:hypothetical protein
MDLGGTECEGANWIYLLVGSTLKLTDFGLYELRLTSNLN